MFPYVSEGVVGHGAANSTEFPQENLYFLGPLGPFVWVPPAIILCAFVVFFSVSFLQFHADNKSRYMARRNRLVMETHTRAEMMAAYSAETLIDILPKPRLRAFRLKVNVSHVMKEIWRYHGANPRKIRALMEQMNMHLELTQRCEGEENKNRRMTSATHAHYGSHVDGPRYKFEGHRLLPASRSNSAPSPPPARTRQGLARGQTKESGAIHRAPGRRARQLPNVPPCASGQGQNVGRSMSPSSVMRRLPEFSRDCGLHGPSPLVGLAPRSFAAPPMSLLDSPVPPLNHHILPVYSDYMDEYNDDSWNSSLDRECENDFIGTRSSSRSKQTADKKKSASVFMMQRIVRKK